MLMHDEVLVGTSLSGGTMGQVRFVWGVLALLLAVGGAQAQSAVQLFADADLALGQRLIQEHRCSECHVRKVGGDGSAIYRPAGRINAPGFLRGMVEQCNTEMNLGLFPEEVSAIAAVLNRDHYRFK
jgi:hypothetical protein